MTFVPASFALQMPLAERSHARTYVCMRTRVFVPGMEKKTTGKEEGGGGDHFDKRRESFRVR